MLQSHFSTILLMRLGSTKRIEQCYNTRTLSFGCAANWVTSLDKGTQPFAVCDG